jgi:hypothetical protein
MAPNRPAWKGMPRALAAAVGALALGMLPTEVPAAKPPARWPGVKVTYSRGADGDEPIVTTYERELRFDGFVPLPLAGEGRRAGVGPYSIRWEGELTVDAPGRYTFRPSDPRARFDLAIDGKAVAWTTFEEEYESHGTRRTRRLPVSEPVPLEAGRVPIRMEIGREDGRVGEVCELLWRGPSLPEEPVPAARVHVAPWEGMRRRPLLRFAMVGHSNVEGRAGRPKPVEARTAWYYRRTDRSWRPLEASFSNHTMTMATMLSEKYPDRFFGGMMLGRGATSVNEDYVPEHRFYHELVRHLKGTAHCGPMVAMGCHFDWDEMKKESRVAAFEGAHVDLITRVRKVLGRPELPWVFTRVSPCFAGPGHEPGPGNGCPAYQVLYRAADRVAAAIPPMGVVTTDDFLNPVQAKAVGVEADCGPEGNFHYTRQGFRKWGERAVSLLARMRAMERALEALECPVTPYPAELPRPPCYPVSIKPDEIVMAGTGAVTRLSRPRGPRELDTYRNALFTVEYRWDVYRCGQGLVDYPAGETVIVVLPSVRDGRSTAAVSFRPGDRHHLQLLTYKAQPEALQQLPFDDHLGQLDKPLYYARIVNRPHADKRRWCEHRTRSDQLRGFTRLVEGITLEDLKPNRADAEAQP